MCMEFGILFELDSVMNLILFYLIHVVFKGENPAYVIWLKKQLNFNVGLSSNIDRPISFNMVW